MQRPPHSLGKFNLDDVKKIDEFVLDNYFRHYEMYKYALTVQENLVLQTNELFTHQDPKNTNLEEGKLIPPREIDDLKQYFSRAEEEAILREQEYMTKGPGRIERIMREEMEKLQTHLEEKIKKQDEEFLAKVAPGKK